MLKQVKVSENILFFIRSLNAGGAERQLVITAKGLVARGHKVTVLTFYKGGFYADELTDTKVQLLSLHKRGRWDLLAFFYRLFVVLRQQAPDVIYSFLGTANILTVLLRPFIPPTRVIWGVRASNMDLDQYDWLSRWSYRVECRLARFADVIVTNSHAGLEHALTHGFPRKIMAVIPNGIDTGHFHPNKSAGERVRKEWNIAEDEQLIGVVGRIDPMKGLPTFLEAAVLAKQQGLKMRFVCIGDGKAAYKNTIHKLATTLGLDDVLIWAGRRSDMVAVYNALDIASSSSSYGEGFPNVIGEAMSCGIPCVVTDVGDSALVVGKTGLVVPAENSGALSAAWLEMLSLDTAKFDGLSAAVRIRVVSEFSVSALLESTKRVLFVQ